MNALTDAELDEPAPITDADAERILSMMAQGLDLPQIDQEMGWRDGSAQLIYDAVTQSEALRQSQVTPEARFASYIQRTAANVRQLDLVYQLATCGDGRKQNLVAAVAAVRAKQDSMDRTIKVGQDLGVIKRTAQRHEILIGATTAPAVAQMLEQEMRQLRDLSRKHGDLGMAEIEAEFEFVSAVNPEPIVTIEAEDDADDPSPAAQLDMPPEQGVALSRASAAPSSPRALPAVVRRKAILPAIPSSRRS